MRAYERLLNYVKVWTTSDEESTTSPTTARQFDLAKQLVEEMKGMGIEDAMMDEYGYVYGHIPATPGYENCTAIGFLAHMDTAPDYSGENVNPQIIENYDGKIYSRIKGTDQLFHSSAFLQTPLQFEGKVLEQCHLILAKYMKSACAIAHDKKNNRLLLIMDASYGSAAGAGEVKICPGKPNTGSVEGWVPLDNMGDNKVSHIGYFPPKGSGQKVGIFMILQDKNGKYWTQEFVLKRQYDTSSYYLEECERNPIDLTSILKENSIIYALPYQVASEFVLISSGADIYLYDRTSPND